jgi:hypothetical protein
VIQGLRDEAKRHASASEVPWRCLKELADGMRSVGLGEPRCERYAYNAVQATTFAPHCRRAMRRKAQPQREYLLHQICRGSALAPLAQRQKSPELQTRLKQLQEQLDNKRYNEMVSDITVHERKADELRNSLLPSARLQLSFGAHVLVTMFTFWATAYYGCKWFARMNELWVSWHFACSDTAVGEGVGAGAGCVGGGGHAE